MQSPVPVVKNPFSIFNIIALVAILVIGYFLYKKFTQKFKSGEITIEHPKIHQPVTIQAVESPSPPPPDDESTPS